MAPMTSTSPAQLLRGSVLLFLFLFAFPAFAVWFVGHCERSLDEDFLEQLTPRIAADASLSESDRAGAIAYYRAHTPSVICASDGPENGLLRAQLGGECGTFDRFRWARGVGIFAIVLGLLASFVTVAGASISALHPPSQYAA